MYLRSRHEIVILAAIACVAVSAALLAPVDGLVWARTIRVPDNAPSIREAVEDAAAGDTVLIAPGTYVDKEKEKLPIPLKSGVVIVGAGPEETIIKASSETRVHTMMTARDLDSLCVIRDLTLDGAGKIQYCLTVAKSTVEITNCHVLNSAEDGIYIGNFSDLKVFDCKLAENNGRALACLQSKLGVYSSVFEGNGVGLYFYGKCESVEIADGPHTANDFIGNLVSPVHNMMGEEVDLRYNFWGTESPSGVAEIYGLAIVSPWVDANHTKNVSLPSITGTTITVPDQMPGIQLAVGAAAEGDTVLVAPGTYYESVRLKSGICLAAKGEPGSAVIRNSAKASRAVLDIEGVQGVTIWGLAVDGLEVAEAGIQCTESEATLLENTVTNCTRHGISCREGSVVEVRLNRLEDNTYGINLWRSRGTVAENTVVNNRGEGIYQGESETVIEKNTVRWNGGSGVMLREVEASTVVRRNTVEGNGKVGIFCSGGSVVLEGNLISGNNWGIFCTSGATPTIAGNAIGGNKEYAIGCEKGAAPVIGGSLEAANDFAGDEPYYVYNIGGKRVIATHNNWGACPQEHMDKFQGDVNFAPWTDSKHSRAKVRCD